METLADLADSISSHGIEIAVCRVRWQGRCSVCDIPLRRDDTYEILTDVDVALFCGICAARLATIAMNRLMESED